MGEFTDEFTDEFTTDGGGIVPVFPALPGIAYPLPRRTIWNSNVAESVSGKRIGTTLRTYPTYGFEVSFADTGFLRSGPAYLEWQQLAGFINKMAGRYGLFLYSYPDDSIATQQPLAFGDGSSTTFQLVRTLGGFTEPIMCPQIPLTTVRVNGVATTAYTLDNYGKLTFNVAPAGGAAIDWTGRFYWPCRFDQDTTDFSNIMLNLYELKSLRFSSEKLP
jgi:hypothetical protein